MGKEDTKAYNTKVFRDFAKVRPVVRALCLRGYKDRDGYRGLAIAKSKCDSILAEIKFALQEDGVIEERTKTGEKRKVYYFHNRPLQKQDNPLAEIWRFAKPNRKTILFYMTILELAQKKDGVTKREIITELECRGAEIEVKLDSSVERVLKEMQQLMLIREVSEAKERIRRYRIESDIWKGLSVEELEEVYIYLDFLKNVVPFELPYYLLQKHLELYFYCCKQEKRLQQIKEMFLFRHRNPVNVLESEMMYYFLRYSKHGVNSRKDVHYQKKMQDYEMSTPKDWEEGLPTVWFQDFCGQIEGLEYDCSLNAIYQKGRIYREECKREEQEEAERYSFIGTDLFVEHEDSEDEEELKKKKAEYAKLQEEIRPLFHEMHGVYFEKIFKLWREKGEYTAVQLRRKLFCNEEAGIEENQDYWDAFLEEILMPTEEAYPLFFYDKESKKYVVEGGRIDVPIASRIQREALQSLEEFTYTKLFLSDEIVQKIKNNTKNVVSEWSIRDINIVNQQHRQDAALLSYEKMQKLLYAMNCNCTLTDKTGRNYIPLRLQYSFRYDEFRLLVVDEERTDCQMLALEDVDFEQMSRDEVITWEEKEEWMQKAADKQCSKTFRLKNDWDSIYWDNACSDDVMMLLSSYDKIVDYTVGDPEKESGQYKIMVKYWPEDEKELIDDFKRVMENKHNMTWEME